MIGGYQSAQQQLMLIGEDVDQINLMIATIKVIDVYCTNDYIQRLLMWSDD